MKVKIDSREQRPINFEVSGSVSTVTTEGLPFGDYWATYENGEEMPIVFERKGMADLFGTLTSGMERFKKELQRCKENNFKMILIVEGTLSEVLVGTLHSTVEGKTILKTMFTLWVKYDLTPVFCPNRSEMKRFMIETWEAVGRNFKPASVVVQSPSAVLGLGGSSGATSAPTP